MSVVVIFGEELFRCADDGKVDPKFGKARLQTIGNERIGNVSAVPSEQEIHAMNTGSREVKGVTTGHGGKDSPRDQFGGESCHLFGEVKDNKSSEQLQSLGRLGGFTLRRLVQHELRGEEIELVPVLIPPFPRKFLPRELQKIAQGKFLDRCKGKT